MYQRILALLIIIAVSTTSRVNAQNWDEVQIQADPLTESIYMLTGAGGNIGILITNEFTVMIDDQFEPLFDKINMAISKLTDKPVRYVINTHWHGDHTGGNTAFADAGATILAHQNVRDRMESGSTIEFFGKEVPPAPNTAVPALTFREDVTLTFGKETLRVIHAPGAHTDGDAIIHFQTSNVIHMGDLYFAGKFPFIDLSSGGSVEGIIAGCDVVLALANDDTRIIPGHGALSNKKELTAYKDMIADIADQVSDMKGNGQTLKAVMEAQDAITGPYETIYGGGFISAKDLLTFIYNSL